MKPNAKVTVTSTDPIYQMTGYSESCLRFILGEHSLAFSDKSIRKFERTRNVFAVAYLVNICTPFAPCYILEKACQGRQRTSACYVGGRHYCRNIARVFQGSSNKPLSMKIALLLILVTNLFFST